MILAWEYGNELNTQDDPPVVLSFMEQMTDEIRRIDPTTPIWPGTMGSHHLDQTSTCRRNRWRAELYCDGPIDAYTLHTYDWIDDRTRRRHADRLGPELRGQPAVRERPPAAGRGRGAWDVARAAGHYTADDENGRIEQEIYQIRMVLGYDQVVGIGSWSSESPLTPIRRHDNRRGLTSYGPGRNGGGSCYPPVAESSPPGARCRLETILRNLPARP